jgi:phosphoenolpyruvate-protein phosphotransferase (PTS system enzyme I)
MGLRSFSMHPTQIASVKQRVLRADTRRLAPLLAQVMDCEDPEAACAQALAGGGAAVVPRSIAA